MNSCEHKNIANKTISLMSFEINQNREFTRCVQKMIVCADCENKYKKIGVLLLNKSEENLWISGIFNYPIFLNRRIESEKSIDIID